MKKEITLKNGKIMRKCSKCYAFKELNSDNFKIILDSNKEAKWFFNTCRICYNKERYQKRYGECVYNIKLNLSKPLGHRNEPYFNNEDEMIYIPPTFEELSIIEKRIYKRLK